MRPGCDRPAAARLAFDPVALQLWLDPLGTRSAPVQELCDFHIERLTIPRGWSATDRRPGPSVSGIEPLPAAPASPPLAEPVVATVIEPVVVTTAPEPVVAPVPEPVVAPAPAPAPEPEPVVAPAATAAPDPAVPSTAPAARKRPAARTRRPAAAPTESSLLSRAFAWTGPQQSILTQGRSDGDVPDDPNDV